MISSKGFSGLFTGAGFAVKLHKFLLPDQHFPNLAAFNKKHGTNFIVPAETRYKTCLSFLLNMKFLSSYVC